MGRAQPARPMCCWLLGKTPSRLCCNSRDVLSLQGLLTGNTQNSPELLEKSTLWAWRAPKLKRFYPSSCESVCEAEPGHLQGGSQDCTTAGGEFHPLLLPVEQKPVWVGRCAAELLLVLQRDAPPSHISILHFPPCSFPALQPQVLRPRTAWMWGRGPKKTCLQGTHACRCSTVSPAGPDHGGSSLISWAQEVCGTNRSSAGHGVWLCLSPH